MWGGKVKSQKREKVTDNSNIPENREQFPLCTKQSLIPEILDLIKESF